MAMGPERSESEHISLRRDIWEARWSQPGYAPAWGRRPCPIELTSDLLGAPGVLPRSGRVLEIGCGLAEIAGFFATRGFSVDAVDISATAIAMAGRLHSDTSIRFMVGDFIGCPLKGPYDIVVDRGCMHGIPLSLRGAYASKIARVTAGAGFFCLFVRVFRGQDPIPMRRELAAHERHIRELFTPAFEVLACRLTDLSPPLGGEVMPGLYFLLKRVETRPKIESPCPSDTS